MTKEEDDTAILLVLRKGRKERKSERELESHRKIPEKTKTTIYHINVYTCMYDCIYKTKSG